MRAQKGAMVQPTSPVREYGQRITPTRPARNRPGRSEHQRSKRLAELPSLVYAAGMLRGATGHPGMFFRNGLLGLVCPDPSRPSMQGGEKVECPRIPGTPFGELDWIRRTARRLGLEYTLNPRGRPCKEAKK